MSVVNLFTKHWQNTKQSNCHKYQSQKRWGWWLHSEGHINLSFNTETNSIYNMCVSVIHTFSLLMVLRSLYYELSFFLCDLCEESSTYGDIHVQWQGSSTDQPKPKTHHICESIFIHTHANTWNTISLSYPETYMAWLMTLDFSSRYSVILAEDNRE